MDLLEDYLRNLHTSYATGQATDETSHYQALKQLLQAVGDELSPPVQVVMNPKDRGDWLDKFFGVYDPSGLILCE